jgi:hypothetical protein
MDGQIGAFREVLAQQPVGVLVGRALPRCVCGIRSRCRCRRRLAIPFIDSPRARPKAISSRSENVRQRPLRSRPRRGLTPPAAASQRVPCLRYVPASAAASVMNSPRAIAAQNRCTTSGSIRSENLAISPSVRLLAQRLPPPPHARSPLSTPGRCSSLQRAAKPPTPQRPHRNNPAPHRCDQDTPLNDQPSTAPSPTKGASRLAQFLFARAHARPRARAKNQRPVDNPGGLPTARRLLLLHQRKSGGVAIILRTQGFDICDGRRTASNAAGGTESVL